MNSADIISVERLSKQYRLGEQSKGAGYTSLREVITQRAASVFKRDSVAKTKSTADAFWALEDVSFAIKTGDVLGIIGRNGAGKSTLLKILSRITEPSGGRVVLRGRVASLLEVGTGFHPELTGRENIFLNGAILGLTKAGIRKKFDEIVAFADVERFLDTPVKRYSSGMYVRLAFAVAAHIEPEILIVDEVLAVGDAQFQKKCFGKMNDVAKGGRTILFVSHNMGMMSRLCKTGLLLEHGRVTRTGGIDEVIQTYMNTGAEVTTNRFHCPVPDHDFTVRIVTAETVNETGSPSAEFGHDDLICLRVSCALNCPDKELLDSIRLTACLVDGMGRRIFIDQTSISRQLSEHRGFTANMYIPRGLLTPGRYTFIINANIPPAEILHRIEDVCPFEITDLGTELAMYKGGDIGCVFAKCSWRVEPVISPVDCLLAN